MAQKIVKPGRTQNIQKVIGCNLYGIVKDKQSVFTVNLSLPSSCLNGRVVSTVELSERRVD